MARLKSLRNPLDGSKLFSSFPNVLGFKFAFFSFGLYASVNFCFFLSCKNQLKCMLVIIGGKAV